MLKQVQPEVNLFQFTSYQNPVCYFGLQCLILPTISVNAVKGLRGYILNFGSLKAGHHTYNYEVDEAFFDGFENSLIAHGSADVLLNIEKQSEAFIILDFSINGKLEAECNRCLDAIDYPFESQNRLIIKIGNEEEQDSGDDELLILDDEAYQLDLSPLIYEFITLSIPLHITCDMEGKECNPLMIAKLNDLKPHTNENETDPRWEGLNKLKNIKNK
ncbi:MAG: DUF177 domain-containing protein [Bacteroidetes bacterium]|nr:DUF177 domain-containing protein [Bacteroidota bacterium]